MFRVLVRQKNRLFVVIVVVVVPVFSFSSIETYIVMETGEFQLAIIAGLASVRAEITAVIVVSQTGDLLAALHSARDRVQRA